MPKGIEKREACEQKTVYCTFNPDNQHQVAGQISFNQLKNCSILINGQFNTNYINMIHITLKPDAIEPSIFNLEEYVKDFNKPFYISISKNPFPADFFTVKKYYCVAAAAFDNVVVLGSAHIL
ncbi:7234_t:CDS:1 [Ambispora gerdemannii]|uniref:7234_t:CDS:1 n=1 Tax=Ambispora gerdemannii TaxID=144530 RepID=A0A9N8ZVZ3_9GLOM|nr:7234_t:CDS:1 [Ambispora gerdemannii]